MPRALAPATAKKVEPSEEKSQLFAGETMALVETVVPILEFMAVTQQRKAVEKTPQLLDAITHAVFTGELSLRQKAIIGGAEWRLEKMQPQPFIMDEE